MKRIEKYNIQVSNKQVIKSKTQKQSTAFLKHIGFALFLIFNSIFSFAQQVNVKAYTDKSKIFLGEPLWLTLETKTLKSASVPAFKVDSIPHFEIIKDSTSKTEQGDTLVLKQYYQLTSFDSGRCVIPPFTLRPFVKTNSVLVDVAFTDGFNPQQPYHDVKKIIDVPFKLSPDIERWWYATAVLLILLTLLAYWVTADKKVKAPRQQVSSASAYKTAMQQLAGLKKTGADQKTFYAQLVEVFRTYVLHKTGISSMQQTSNNLVEQLKPLYKDKERYNKLGQVLHLCDFVKFAKYQPDNNEAASAFDVIEDSINYMESESKKTEGNR